MLYSTDVVLCFLLTYANIFSDLSNQRRLKRSFVQERLREEKRIRVMGGDKTLTREPLGAVFHCGIQLSLYWYFSEVTTSKKVTVILLR